MPLSRGDERRVSGAAARRWDDAVQRGTTSVSECASRVPVQYLPSPAMCSHSTCINIELELKALSIMAL